MAKLRPSRAEVEPLTEWNEQFEALVRLALPYLEDSDPLLAETELVDFGLNSVGMVGLIADLESEFGLVVPEEHLNRGTFRTAGGLWALVARLL